MQDPPSIALDRVVNQWTVYVLCWQQNQQSTALSMCIWCWLGTSVYTGSLHYSTALRVCVYDVGNEQVFSTALSLCIWRWQGINV